MKKLQLNTNIQWEEYSGQELSAILQHHIFLIDAAVLFPLISQPEVLLSVEESQKAGRFIRREDQENYLVRKYILRQILSRFVGLAPAQISYFKTANKKPSIKGIHFNSSHSKQYIAIAISADPIGIDIEFYQEDFDFSDLINNCFSAEESSFINAETTMQQNFYTLWTRKEALIKATGEGIVEALNQIPSLFNTLERENSLFNINTVQWQNSTLSVASSAKAQHHKFWTILKPFYGEI